jgi:hypothetical protein
MFAGACARLAREWSKEESSPRLYLSIIAHLILHISIILHRGVYTKHEGVVVEKDMDRENQSK